MIRINKLYKPKKTSGNMIYQNAACKIIDPEGNQRPLTVDNVLNATIGKGSAVIIGIPSSPVELIRYGSTPKDTYFVHMKTDSLKAFITGTELRFGRHSMPITGRGADRYDVIGYFEGENVILSERLSKNRDRLYVEIGAGFSELVFREAKARKKEGGIKPMVIDICDYQGLDRLLAVVGERSPTLRLVNAMIGGMIESTLPLQEVRQRVNIISNPEYVTHIPVLFPDHLAVEDIEKMVKVHDGAHTAIDVFASDRYQIALSPRREVEKLLAHDGIAIVH